ncbi:unnamed protein product [Schistocephalus solidus]|uniref:Uncharacterized protein n=1 Tax=Schistocephalus solidus TaxID=70667 RepID=A0A183TN79_SCHSO|nr:unnamed protein product [Schistocephalus solidus]
MVVAFLSLLAEQFRDIDFKLAFFTNFSGTPVQDSKTVLDAEKMLQNAGHHSPRHGTNFSNQIIKKLEDLHAPDNNATVETRWCQLRKAIQSTALEVLGRAHRQHKDWFDDNDADISKFLAEKNQLHKAYVDRRTNATKGAFFRCRCLVQQRLWEMHDAWMVRMAEEIQGYADRNEIKNFIKAIYGPCIKGTAPLLSSDGTTLLTEKSQIWKRWAEHFRSTCTNQSPCHHLRRPSDPRKRDMYASSSWGLQALNCVLVRIRYRCDFVGQKSNALPTVPRVRCLAGFDREY